MDAIELITSDHRTVEALFGELERAGGAKARGQVFARIKKELDTHAAIEEERLYPAVAQADPSARAEVERSLAEHRMVKTLLRETAAMSPQAPGFEANVTLLRRNVEEHVAEEEGPGGILQVARRALGAGRRAELGREMAEHRKGIESGARGVLTAAAEAVQSVVERGQKMMDGGANASRQAMKAGASARRSAARTTASAARTASRSVSSSRGRSGRPASTSTSRSRSGATTRARSGRGTGRSGASRSRSGSSSRPAGSRSRSRSARGRRSSR